MSTPLYDPQGDPAHRAKTEVKATPAAFARTLRHPRAPARRRVALH
jgi:hypothetical protein